MASHFSSIGFPVDDHDGLLALARRLVDKSEEIACASGYYLRWTSESGPEVWFQVDAERRLVGVIPHFDGDCRLDAGLAGAVSRPGQNLLDGSMEAWVEDPAPGDGESGRRWSFVFDTPDARAFPCWAALPFPARVQLAAFAHQLQLWPGLDSYREVAADPDLDAEAGLSAGLIRTEAGPDEAEGGAWAVFTGRIEVAQRRTNPVTEEPFWWMRVKTVGGTVDVVADPAILESDPVDGGVAQGVFWLSGRVREYVDPVSPLGVRVFRR